MKKLVSLILAAALLLSLALPASAAAHPFTDVPANAWYAQSVEYVYANKLFNGTSSTKFSPDTTMNRAMFVKVLSNLTVNYNEDDWKNKNSFLDVKRGQWYSAPIAWAAKANLANGVGDNKFGIKNDVTREQAVVFMYNYAVKTGNDTSSDPYALQKFSDGSKVSSWAQEAMKWAVTNDIVNITNGKLNPREKATRAEVAYFFAHAESALAITYVDVEPGPDEPELSPREAYRTVLNNLEADQKKLASYMRFARGFYYDLDGNGLDELIVLHEAQKGYTTYRAVSVYTLKDGKAVALMNAQKLYDEVSAPQGNVHVMTKGGKTYLALYDKNGGSAGPEGMHYTGKWELYVLKSGKLTRTNRVDFSEYTKASSRNTAKIDGKATTYAKYQQWEKGYTKKISIANDKGGYTLQQLLKQI